jgi:hypothetical protein
LGGADIEQREVRVAIRLVVIGKVAILGAINLGKNYLIAEPLLKIVIEFIPVLLKDLAPVTLLHVEVQQYELARVLFNQSVQFFGAVDLEALCVLPPVLGLCGNDR